MSKRDRDCPICAAPETPRPTKYARDGWCASECAKCKFLYLRQVPQYAELSETLAWTKQFQKEAQRRKEANPWLHWMDHKTRWRLKLLRGEEANLISLKLAGGNVLDVGCGARNRVPKKFVPFGIEIGKDAAQVADRLMRAAGGRVVHAPAVEGLRHYDDDFFHGMIMRSYLEHETEPKRVLELCFDKLKNGGVIYVKVPNYECIGRRVRGVEWCGFRFPDHVNYFDVRSLRRLAKDIGYLFELRSSIDRFSNDNIHCFLRKPA